MTDFLKLSEQCAIASGTTFELNALIARQDFFREEHGDCADNEVPDFGGSVDAAILLIPTGHGWNLQGNTSIFYATVFGKSAQACTPGLALSAAALRARHVGGSS